jgi:hypothetical protein
MSKFSKPVRRPLIKLRHYIQEHQPRILQQDLAMLAKIDPGFMSQIMNGVRPMPAAVRAALLRRGIPEGVLPAK